MAWAVALSLSCALVFAQSLLRLHVSQHGLGHMGQPAYEREHAQHTDQEARHSEAQDPWGHAAGSEPCQWLDHLLLAYASAADGPSLVADVPSGAGPAPGVASPRPGRAARPYEARGPPGA